MPRSSKVIVDNKKKIVKANIGKLTEKQIKLIKNYLALGYVLEAYEEKKIYTKENIEKFVKAKKVDFDIKKLMNELNEEGRKKGFVYALKVFRNNFDDEFVEFMSE